jgi:hypothetical protein
MKDNQHEQLFTDLTPEQAAVLEGGAPQCPYTTRGVNSWLNIRSGPGTQYSDIGNWYPNKVKYMELPAITQNGFRAFNSLRTQWVSTRYIKSVPGPCFT